MTYKKEIRVTIKPTWNIVKNICDEIEDILSDKEQYFIDAVTMVAEELIENAVKYGEPLPDDADSGIRFEMKIDDAKIYIKVVNGVYTDIHIKNVVKHIDAIRNSKDTFALYTKRLNELMDNANYGVSQLGLYRISYEGKFTLNYEYADNVLSVIAERVIE